MDEQVKPVACESSVDTKSCKNCSKCSFKTHRLINVLIGRSIKSVRCQRLLETELLRRLQAGSCCRGNDFIEPVFDLEFSPDDKIMIAGGKGSNISVFDPCMESKITTFDSKHFGFSRLIFLDSLTFATCSDDNYIALWDLRKLKESLMVLHGHTNPVKSMNYNSTTKQLISASFDDTVRLWNLDEYQTDGSVSSEIILTVPDLLRAELSQDFDKFFISTSKGLLLYFNNVDLNSLTKNYDEEFSKFDSRYFETPYGSRHYFSRTYFGNISKSKSLSNDRNKLWVLDDFPKDGVPSLISTVAISPNEKCVYTRYETQSSEEWSALHSIEGTDKVTESSSNWPLLKYIQEENNLYGYIKEASFSFDGRVVCSPWRKGIHLLALNEELNEMSDHIKGDYPSEFTVIPLENPHSEEVLCARFCHTKHVLASGCFNGDIYFYQPKF